VIINRLKLMKRKLKVRSIRKVMIRNIRKVMIRVIKFMIGVRKASFE